LCNTSHFHLHPYETRERGIQFGILPPDGMS